MLIVEGALGNDTKPFVQLLAIISAHSSKSFLPRPSGFAVAAGFEARRRTPSLSHREDTASSHINIVSSLRLRKVR